MPKIPESVPFCASPLPTSSPRSLRVSCMLPERCQMSTEIDGTYAPICADRLRDAAGIVHDRAQIRRTSRLSSTTAPSARVATPAPAARIADALDSVAWYDRLMSTVNSFGTRTRSTVGGRSYQIYSLPALQRAGFPEIARLPYSLKILLENLLRHEDGRFVKAADIEALATWDVKSTRAEGDLVRAGARAAAGFHRRARGRRSRGDARRHRAARRRSEPRQPAAAGRARHRSLGAGRLLRRRRTPFS